MAHISSRRRQFDRVLCLVLVLVAGLWMAWKVPRARAQRRAVEAVKAYGGWVHYDFEYPDGNVSSDSPTREPRWLWAIPGDEYFHEVARVNLARAFGLAERRENPNVKPADEILAKLEPLAGLKELELQGTQAADDGLKHLRGMTGLERLILRGVTEVTNAGAAHLAGLKHLKVLHLTGSRMTDAGLANLRGLTRLEHLTLQDGHFSDAGLVHLSELRNLRRLYLGLGDGGITDAGLMQLTVLPRLQQLWISEENGLITTEGIAKLRAAKPGLHKIR